MSNDVKTTTYLHNWLCAVCETIEYKPVPSELTPELCMAIMQHISKQNRLVDEAVRACERADRQNTKLLETLSDLAKGMAAR